MALSRRVSGRSAFTLIECIGVLAVIAILVGVIAPSVVRRVDHAAWTKETADLQVIADSYMQYILRSKTIPTYTTWDTVVAREMSLPVSTITTNMRRYARAFLINGTINGTNLPYVQTSGGTTKPVSPRVMIVSSLARALPISSGVPSTIEFNAIWDTAEGARPSTATWSNWGSGEDLRIKRLNLEPLFHQLILVDHDPANPTLFSIDSTNALPTGLVWNKYYLDGTVIGLYDSKTNLQTRHRLKRSISFVFESGAWPEGTRDGPVYSGTGAEFADHAMTFLNSPLNPYAAKGGTQHGVIIAMYTFMFDYALWANECPHFSSHGQSNPQAVPEYMLLNNQGQNNGNLDKFSLNLIAVPNN